MKTEETALMRTHAPWDNLTDVRDRLTLQDYATITVLLKIY